MNYHLFSAISVYFITLSVAQCVPVKTASEKPNISLTTTVATSTPLPLPSTSSLPPPQLPEIISYEYTKNATGYMYSYFLTNSISRAETFEIKNKGLPAEETIVTGSYGFEGSDGYRYIIKYIIDKSGNHIEIERFSIHRIHPNVLKSLIG